jgi:FkbM family methyltransferase
MVDSLYIQYSIDDLERVKFNVINKGKLFNAVILVCEANYHVPVTRFTTSLPSNTRMWFVSHHNCQHLIDSVDFRGFRYLVTDTDTGERYEYSSSMLPVKRLNITLPDIYSLGDSFDYFFDALYTEKMKYLFSSGYEGTVVDLGANLGGYIAGALRYGKRDVLAIEPTPVLFRSLKKTYEEFRSVKIVHGAITTREESTVNLAMEQPTAYVCNRVAEEGIVVPNYNLEEFTKSLDSISLLKMDIEGEEYNVLPALSKEFFDRTKSISLETHVMYGGQDDHLVELLKSHGFEHVLIDDREAHREHYFWKPSGLS